MCYDRVVELGCYDGKSIEFLPEKPIRYYGFDAGQGGGVYAAMERFPDFTFIVSSSPSDISLSEKATLAISLETLEHIPPDILEDYLKNIRDAMATNAYFLVTVPNEKGVIFLLKYLLKKLIYGDTREYSLKEFGAATLGRMHLVKRGTHKGFDWQLLVEQLKKYFTIIEVEGVQLPWLPPSLNVTIGIVCIRA